MFLKLTGKKANTVKITHGKMYNHIEKKPPNNAHSN